MVWTRGDKRRSFEDLAQDVWLVYKEVMHARYMAAMQRQQAQELTELRAKRGLPNRTDYGRPLTEEESEFESPLEPVLLPLTIDDSYQPVDTPLHGVSWKDESHPMWVRIRTVMDSGAAESVAPPTMAPQVSISE